MWLQKYARLTLLMPQRWLKAENIRGFFPLISVILGVFLLRMAGILLMNIQLDF